MTITRQRDTHLLKWLGFTALMPLIVYVLTHAANADAPLIGCPDPGASTGPLAPCTRGIALLTDFMQINLVVVQIYLVSIYIVATATLLGEYLKRRRLSGAPA